VTVVVLPVGRVTPVEAAVTMPVGWPVPVPVVKCWLVMRPIRSIMRWRMSASRSTSESCRSSMGTAMSLDE
jgi:hypothetical protein